MRSGGSGPKGSEFERTIAKRFSLWISNGTRSDLLWRSAMSGGRATLQLSKGIINRSQSGDLTAIDVMAQDFINYYVTDMKHYKDLDLISGFIKGKGVIFKAWTTLLYYSKIYQKNPLLVARQNNLPILLIMTPAASGYLGLQGKHVMFLPRWQGAAVYLFDDLTPKFW